MIPSLPALALPTPMGLSVAMNGLSLEGGEDDPRYGMSMWFKVKVSDMGGKDLGEWSACSNLGVTFKSEAVKSASSSVGAELAPLDVEFPDITLTRAMDPKSSKRVREWLERVAETWVLDDGSKPPYQGSSVSIKLYSALRSSGDKNSKGHQVAEWNLDHVYPKSWTGPQLDANSNSIATEKLVLAHGGWMKLSKESNPAVSLFDGKTLLRFPDAPQKVTVNRSAKSGTASTGATVVQDASNALVDHSKTNMGFTVTVSGVKEVRWAHDQLLGWLKTRFVDDKWVRDDTTRKWSQPMKDYQRGLVLQIGAGAHAVKRAVYLLKADATYTRFSTTGTPNRADFNLGFEVITPEPGKSLGDHFSVQGLGAVDDEPTGPTIAQPERLKGFRPGVAPGKGARPTRTSSPIGSRR